MSIIKDLIAQVNQGAEDTQSGMAPSEAPATEETQIDLPPQEEQTDPTDPNKKKKPQDTNTLRKSATVAGNKEQLAQSAMNSQLMTDETMGLSGKLESDENSWSADRAYASFWENSGENVLYGVGTMVKGWGDVAQALGGMFAGDWDGNAVSRALQEAGEDLERKYTTFMPEEMQDPKFSMSTFLDSRFWSTHGARFVPQLVEILMTYGAASATRKGLQSGAKALLKNQAKRAGKTTTTGAFKGAAKVNEVAGSGKGIIGKVLTDEGNFTKGFSQLLETTTAGTLTNLRVSLANAGEMYNTYANLENENGEKIFTAEEAGEMAAGAFGNNMQYLGMDILSWGMTFGRGNFLKQLGLSGRALNKGAENVKAAFLKSMKPFMYKAGKLGTKMAREGAEEMVQESFEEWSKMEAYRDKYGSLEGYQGKVSKEYKEGLPGFFEFLQSSDSEGIRTIAFGMGGLAGGAFNIKTLFNREADKARKMRNRVYAMEQYSQDLNNEETEMHRHHMYSQIAELVFDGKGEAFAGFINQMQQNGHITDEEVETYTDLYDRLAEDAQQIKSLDIKGKRGMMHWTSMEKYLEDSVRAEQEKHNARVQFINDNILDEEQRINEMKRETAIYDNTIQGLAYGIARSKKNKQSILSGRKAQDVEMGVNDDKSDIKISTVKIPKNFRSDPVLSKMYQDIYNAVMTEGQQESEQEQDIMQEATEDPEGFMSELAEGEEIIIDGMPATVTGVGVNSEGASDNFNYEIPGQVNEETGEETEPATGNIRLTKKGTFFDDRTNKQSTLQRRKPQPKAEQDSNVDLDEDEEVIGQESRLGNEEEMQEFFSGFENVTYNPRRKNVTKKTYETFQKEKTVPSGVLENLARKIVNQEQLTKEETDITTANYDAIRQLIGLVEIEIDTKTKAENLDEKTQNYVEKASKRTGKKKSLQKQAAKEADQNSDNTEKISLAEKARKKAAEVFRAGKKQVDKVVQKAKELNQKATEELNKGKDQKNMPNKPPKQVEDFTRFIKKAVLGITNATSEIGSQFARHIEKRHSWKSDHAVLSMMKMNDILAETYPDALPRAYVLDNLYAGVGIKGTAYTVGAAMFFNPKSWEQDKTVMHEMSHIHYAITKDHPETKKLMKFALRNEKLVEHIRKVYNNRIFYKRFNAPKGTPGRRYALISKKRMIEAFPGMTPQELDTVINAQIKNELLEELPLEQQPIIAEEVFVATVEGPASTKYKKFFQERFDTGRQSIVKKWWSYLHKSAMDARNRRATFEKSLTDILSPEENQEFVASKEAFINGFKEETKGYPIGALGREQRIDELENDAKERIMQIREERIANQEEYVGNPQEALPEEAQDLKEALEQEMIGEEGHDVDAKFGRQALAYVDRAGKLIRQFNTAYGIAMNRRFFVKSKGKTTNWRRMPVYDGDLLHIKLVDMAKNAENADHFIYMIENSEIEEVFEFNEFLNDVRQDKKAFLGSLYHLNKNHRFVNSVKMFVNRDGTIDMQSSLNNRELSIKENQQYHLIRQIGAAINGSNDPNLVSNYEQYKASADNIRSNDFTNQDVRTVLKFLGGNKINVDKIMAQGYINYKGQTYEINHFLQAFLTAPAGIGGGIVPNVFGNPRTKAKAEKDKLYLVNERTVRKGVSDFIEALIVTNRPFTAEYTVTDANGNLAPAREVNNMMFGMIDKMTNDATNPSFTKTAFIKKYASVTPNLSTGSRSNEFLGKIYDDIVNGNGVALNRFDGILNQRTANSNTLKQSNGPEHSMMEFSMFMTSAYQYEGKSPKSNYMMELGRMSDSPRSFIMEVPRYALSNIAEVDENGNFKRINKKSAKIIAGYEINKKAGFNGTIDDYIQSLEEEIQAEIDFLNEQGEYASELTQIAPLFTKEKVNQKGKNILAEYVLNQHLNGSFFMEAFLPGFKGTDVVKRAKYLTSPYMSLGNNVRIEAIPILDPENDQKIKVNDGAMYMREEDIERVRKVGGNLMDVGKGIKGLHAGVEYSNSKFLKKPIYNKGYIFMLNEEIVAKNPKLKGIWDMLNARAKHYESKMGGYETDLQSGFPSHLPYAYHTSADKSGIMPASFNKNRTRDGLPIGPISQNFSLENIGKNTNEINEFLDSIYYDKQGKFIGLSGSNFGVQLTMDKVSDTSTVSVQLMKAVTTNAAINGTMDVAEGLQRNLTNIMEKNLKEIYDVFASDDVIAMRELIKKHMNIPEMDPIQAQAILIDGLSFNTPELRIIARNQLANIVRMKGNKIKAPGTIAQQMPDNYGKPYNTGGTDKLAYYAQTTAQEESDIERVRKYGGTTNKKIFRTGTKPMEGVVPGYMIGQNVKKREYYTLDKAKEMLERKKLNYKSYAKMTTEEKLGILKKMAVNEAQKRGTKVNIVYGENGTTPIGFYAEGDTIIATRIPAHGPQTTGVVEVIDFHPGESSNIQTPEQFSLKVTGGDFDGDQLFIQHGKARGTDPNWREFMNGISEYWLTPEMQKEVKMPIDHKSMVDEAKVRVPEIGQKNIFFTPNKKRQDFQNTRSTSESIGIVANAHSLIGMLSAYNANFDGGFSINGIEKNTFQDTAATDSKTSRTITSANIFQIVLDNAKDQSAQQLGINKQTAVLATILINLGYKMDDIAVILRSPVVERYVHLMSRSENNFSPINKSSSGVMSELKKEISFANKTRNINTNQDINSASNREAIFNMLETAEKLNSDFIRLNGLLSQHNQMEINPFQLQDQITEFQQAMDNQNNATLRIPEGFKTNPIVQNYQNTADTLLGILQKIDPVYRAKSAKLHQNILEASPKTMSKAQKQKVYDTIELFHTARSLGFNNIPMEHLQSLTKRHPANSDKKNMNIFDRLDEHMEKMKKNIVQYNPDDPKESITELDSSLLFSKLLSTHLKGRNKHIGLNSSYWKQNVDSNLKKRATMEFEQLPTDLKNDLILYDLMVNGFKSGSSIFPLLPTEFRQAVSDAADTDVLTKDFNPIDDVAMRKLHSAILLENPELSITSSKLNPYLNKKNEAFSFKWLNSNPKIKERLLSGKPFYFQHEGNLHYFVGGRNFLADSKLLYKNTRDDKLKAAATIAPKYVRVMQMRPNNYNEGVVAIPDENTGAPYFQTDLEETISTWDEMFDLNDEIVTGMESRPGEVVEAYYKYEEELSRQEFDEVMNYDIGVQEDQKQILYRGYQEDFEQASRVAKQVNENTVKSKSNEELHELYTRYGHMNKFAYAKVLNPITMELAQRGAVVQMKEYNGNEYDKKDISIMQRLLMSNNVPSNHPATQAAVRNIEKAYKEYQVERTRMLKQVNEATNKLYQEKLGFKIRGGNWMDFLKSLYYSFGNLLNRDKFYKNLYGNLIIVEKSKSKEGLDQTYIKYKPKEQIEEQYKNGKISEAEYEFYTVTSALMKEMEPHVVKDRKGRADYVPHVAPDLMEKLSSRGLLGALVHSRTINEQIYDVHMDFNNPITGEMERNVPFKYIEDVYNSISVNKKAPLKHSGDFVKLKKRAYDLYKKGKNEDGTDIRFSNLSIGTAIGDVFMNHFSGTNGVKAKDLPSMDLNKAFNDYITSALFVHGNDKFAGMKKMLPVIDGLLAQAHRDRNPNMEAYVENVWRKYFLKGSKKQSFKNSNALLAVGVTTDDVVDFLTKGSLFYWLGYKGLALGAGIYAIGNVVVGKYHNVKNRSGKEWVKGEKRFWFGKTGRIDFKDPMKGVRESSEILKNIGFLDINIYDEIHASKKNSIDTMLGNIALAPMVKTEQWIQGVHFLGMLTDQEWDTIRNGGRLNWDRLNYLEEEVKRSHGKGYQPTDQRMIQMYSWGRAVLQFSRYLPTMAYDRLAKKDIDRYGRLHMGAYTAVWEPIQKMITGDMKMSEFKEYYEGLSEDQRRRFDSGIKGFGFMTLLLGSQQVLGRSEYANDLFWDANSLINFEKLKFKTTPPSISMVDQLFNF